MAIVKVPKIEDIAAMIQRIKNLEGREVVFELPKGSRLFENSNNLKLMKKSGEVLGKKITISTKDEMGKILARKAGLLHGEAPPAKLIRPQLRVKRSDVKPRFSDIVNPKRIPLDKQIMPGLAKTLASVATVPVLEKIKPSKIKMPRFSSNSFSKVFMLSMVVLVLAAFALAVLLPQALITVYARSEPITRDIEITVDKNAKALDAEQLIVPGAVVAKEISITKNFPATGSKALGTKATGQAVLHNDTQTSLRLRSSTTTLIAAGKEYTYSADVQIPANGEVNVNLTAKLAGPDHNIPLGTRLDVRNAALGNNPNVYATASSDFTGGAVSQSDTVVSQADIDKATAALSEELALEAEREANTDGNPNTNTRILPSAITKEILAATASKNVNDEATDFDMTMIAKISGLSYQEEDVEAIVLEKINSVLSEDKYLVPEEKSDTTAKFKTLDVAAGKGVMSVHFETIAAYKVDDANLSKVLAGKNANEIKEILLMKPEIDRVDVEFKPFFVNKAPKFNGKIYIETKLSGT